MTISMLQLCFCVLGVHSLRLNQVPQADVSAWKDTKTYTRSKACTEASVTNILDESGNNTCRFISDRVCFPESFNLEQAQYEGDECLAFKPSCAVVGSSGHLLNSTLGKEIESHDVVIRINAAPTGEFSKDVGSRTDVRFINQHGLSATWEKNPKCVFLFEPDMKCPVNNNYEPTAYNKCVKEAFKCRGRKQAGEGNWGKSKVIMDNLNANLAQKLRTGQFSGVRTGGLVAIAHALRTCQDVSLYGFGPACDFSVATRYYENKHVIWDGHKYDEEYELLRHWGGQGISVPIAWPIQAKSFKLNVPKCWESSWKSAEQVKPKQFSKSMQQDTKVVKADVRFFDAH